MVILSRSCHDLAMILASVPGIMISHDLGKGTMVNHDLARLTMIMASVPWLRTLGIVVRWPGIQREIVEKAISFPQCCAACTQLKCLKVQKKSGKYRCEKTHE